MRALPLLLLLAACAAPGAAPPALRCDGSLTVRNRSGAEVEQLFVNGGADLLAPATLRPGAQRAVPAQRGPGNAVRVVFADGRAAEIAGLDSCETPGLDVLPGALQAVPPR
ncbi:hypothetical protein ACI6QG_17100 [Roseococcus sp. DSY-14]|uniref:hypothetical protein n=1 Tax=Roseococcus sp. DSY-14 TaxID=3369650 RepID=UPI00387B1EED